ncbi:MAG: hypothetical protein K6356_00190 [Chloroflexus sp.]
MLAVVKRWSGWVLAIIAGGLIATGLELALGNGGGGIGIALSVIGGGLITHWRQRSAISCRVGGPRLRPLQISAFGLMGLGVQWYQLHGDGAVATLSAVWSGLAAPWIAPALVSAGVGWLALLSIGSDCRDEQLLAAMGERTTGNHSEPGN